MDILAKPLDKHGITLVQITYPPLESAFEFLKNDTLNLTLYKVGSVVLWRLFSTSGNNISTVEG